MVLVALAAVLGACGASEARSLAPTDAALIDGGEIEIASDAQPAFASADARIDVWTTEDDLAAVEAFYSDELTEDGWRVVSIDELAEGDKLLVLTREDEVARVNLLAGPVATAEEQLQLFEAANLDVDEDEVEDDETVIVITSFDCREPAVEACLPG